MDYLQFIFQAINNLLTQNLGFFDTMGQHLFRSFATILIVWFGVKSALSAAGGKHPFQFDNFASLVLTISFGFGMINYYSNPIPGMGTSFHNLITDEAQFLTSKINQAELQTVIERVSDFETRMDSPTWGDILGTLVYAIIIILAFRCPGNRHRRNRIRVYCNGRVCAGGSRLHSVLYRAETGVALLGLVSLLHPIRFLPGNRSGGRFCHRQT